MKFIYYLGLRASLLSVFLVAILTVWSPESSYAQSASVTVSGVVVDANNAPLPGVTVIEKGTTNGTTTNANGAFSLSAGKQSTILFSYIGYAGVEFTASTLHNRKVVLQEDTKTLDEVVVVGYATQKKVNLTGSVSSVNIGDVVESRPLTNLSTALSGLSAGLYVNQNSGRPNSDDATLLVRGQGTLNSSSPLVIIDGVEGSMRDVNPQDVESVSILKDASSSSIYGSRAANGVILVTTRKGKDGKFSVSYNGYLSFSKPSNAFETVSNYADYMEYYNEAMKNTDANATPQYSASTIKLWRDHPNEPLLYPNTDYRDEVFSTGVSNNHNLSFSAGSKGVSAFGSFGYLDNPGIVENSAYERYSARLNVSADLKKWITLGLNASGSRGRSDIGSNYVGDLFGAFGTPCIVYRSPDGRYGGPESPEENTQSRSPLHAFNSHSGNIIQDRLTTRLFGTIKIIKGLKIDGSFNYRLANNREDEKPVFADCWSFQRNVVTQIATGDTYVRNKSHNTEHLLMDAIAHYELDVTSKLKMNLMAGASQEKQNVKWFEAKKLGLIADNIGVIGGATGDATADGNSADWVMRSYFGRMNLSWEDKYLFEGNLRSDASSRFRRGKRWGVFPSFSAGWNISREKFMQNITWLDMLKVRGSWGALGNNSVGNYEYQSVYEPSNYVLNGKPVDGLAQLILSNANITWESTYVTNIGVDFSILKSRLNGTVEIFNKDTRNILIDLPAPLLVGTAKLPTQNAARVSNKGVELSLKWSDKIGQVKYFVGGNFTYIRNEVTRYKGDEANIKGSNMIKEGEPINVQYVLAVDRILQTKDDMLLVKKMIKYAPIDPETGVQVNPFATYGTPQLGDFLYKDLNGDGIIDDNDRYSVGYGAIPPISYGISLGAEWKGIDFSMLLQGVWGKRQMWKDKYNMGYLNHGDVITKQLAEGAWREGRTDATYPRLLTRTNTINDVPSDFWVSNKSYMRIKNIQIGYRLPESITKKLDISQVRIYTSLENMFTFTNYKGMDPEVGGTNYPTLKQISIGLNITF